MIQIKINMPNECRECPFSYDAWCIPYNKSIDIENKDNHGNTVRPNWCPLKEVKE